MSAPPDDAALVPPVASNGAAEGQRIACEHADRCGGCPVIALTYGEQLALKRGRVVQSVSRYSALELLYTEPVALADPITEYRTRAKLIVATGGRVGLFEKGGGHNVIDIPQCRVLARPLARAANVLRRRITADETGKGVLAPFDAINASAGGGLRAVDLREVHDPAGGLPKVLVTLVVQRSRAPSLDVLREAARSLMEEEPSVAGVAVNFHEGEAPQILGNETLVLEGLPVAPDRLGGSTHLATFGSFVQAHRGQTRRIHALVAEALAPARGREGGNAGPPPFPRVLDLYGGSGAIALSLAAKGFEVTLVESFAPAVANAQAAATSQGITLRAECADVAAALRALHARGERFEAAVVNPPRRGMSPSARDALARFDLATIAYVSCETDTLARDLDHLARLGFAAARLIPLDMIPLTDEVETVAVLRKTALPLPRVAYEDPEVLIVEKGPHEPTTPQGEYASSLLARAQRIPGAGRAVPVHRIDIGTSGLVMLAKDPSFVAAWAEALHAASARKIYVAATRGITPAKGAITRDLREDGRSYPARTRYRRLAVASGHSVLRVIPEQGRTHQIRRHLAAIGHPVLGDDRYGHAPTNRFFEEKNGLDRAFLHCVRLELDHPKTGARLLVEAPLPGDLRAVLERTSGPGTLRFLEHKNALGSSSSSGISSLPPAPDSYHERGSALDVDASSPTMHPEPTGADEDELGGGRRSGGF
jgi:23S rRNA (uracil1939-C5)-methyltransferase